MAEKFDERAYRAKLASPDNMARNAVVIAEHQLRNGIDPVLPADASPDDRKQHAAVIAARQAIIGRATPSAANVAHAERARIGTIISSEHAKGRERLAQHLAMNTDMSAKDAIETLKAALFARPEIPKRPTVENSAFERAMATGNPEVGAGAGDDDYRPAATRAELILRDFKRATGRKPD